MGIRNLGGLLEHRTGTALLGASPAQLATMIWLALAAACMWLAFFPLLADDAYIVARYVRQLYAGHGLVFNVGERINALTSPLHALVLAAIQALFADAVTAYRVLALLATALSLLAVASKAYKRVHERMLFLALTLGSPLVAFWTVGGMETPLLLCLCTWIAWLALSTSSGIYTATTPLTSSGNEATRAAMIIALAGVATLTRYDSILFVAPVAGFALWRQWRRPRVVLTSAIAAAVVLGWVAFTLAYYGDILPTSFYVKAPFDSIGSEIGRGTVYLVSFVVLTALVALIARRLFHRGAHVVSASPYAFALLLGIALEALYTVFAGTKHMMYAYRLFVPYLPAVVLLLWPQRAPVVEDDQQTVTPPWTLGILAYQSFFALVLYYWSQNPNLSLLYRVQDVGDELYEFSTTGAKYTGDFLSAVHDSARDIDRHWQSLPESRARAPRLNVMTGGLLPYLMPDAYVLELLVSYRHHCKPPLYQYADYVQVVHKANDPVQLPEDGIGTQWQRINAQPFTVRGLHKQAIEGVVEIWYRRNPASVPLPADVNGPCTAAKPA